jgi:predicted RNase H-like HicB family nuclease
MKTLEYYMGLNYKIEVVRDETEGGYVLSIPELNGCITCADSLGKGMEMLEDAKKQWFIAALDSRYDIQELDILFSKSNILRSTDNENS